MDHWTNGLTEGPREPHAHRHTNSGTDKQTDRPTDRPTGRRSVGMPDRWTFALERPAPGLSEGGGRGPCPRVLVPGELHVPGGQRQPRRPPGGPQQEVRARAAAAKAARVILLSLSFSLSLSLLSRPCRAFVEPSQDAPGRWTGASPGAPPPWKERCPVSGDLRLATRPSRDVYAIRFMPPTTFPFFRINETLWSKKHPNFRRWFGTRKGFPPSFQRSVDHLFERCFRPFPWLSSLW